MSLCHKHPDDDKHIKVLMCFRLSSRQGAGWRALKANYIENASLRSVFMLCQCEWYKKCVKLEDIWSHLNIINKH